MRFKKFWNEADYIGYIASGLAGIQFFLLSTTPLFLEFFRKMLEIAVACQLLENGFTRASSMTFAIIVIVPTLAISVLAGLASRLVLASLRFTEFKLLRFRLRRLEKRLADAGHPYRVLPEASRMTRMRVAEDLEDDIALHDELRQEFMKISS